MSTDRAASIIDLTDSKDYDPHVTLGHAVYNKRNKIEHRLFSQITMNWRGKPLTTLEAVVSLPRLYSRYPIQLSY